MEKLLRTELDTRQGWKLRITEQAESKRKGKYGRVGLVKIEVLKYPEAKETAEIELGTNGWISVRTYEGDEQRSYVNIF